MKRRLSHEMRPSVEAAGLMKPSFFTNHFDSDGEYINQTKKVLEPESEPKKNRKHRRRISEFNLKKYEGEKIYLGSARNQSAMGHFNGSQEEDTAIEVSSKMKEPKKEKKLCEASDKLPSPKKLSKGSKMMMNDDDFFFMENSLEKPVESNLKQYQNFYLSQAQKQQK